MKYGRQFQIAALSAVIVIDVAARLWRLTDSCLWFDEIFSVHAAEHSWNTIFSFVALDLIHPPLFYVLLKLWIGVGGESLSWLRLFPVVFSLIAVIPFLLFCRELRIRRWTAIVALFLFSVNGSLIKYAQEVRMYSLLMCLSLFSMWLFARYFVKGKSFVPLVIVNVLMVYTHYFGWFVVLSEVALIVWFQRIKWRRIVVMSAITFACFLPWTIAVLMAARSGSGLVQNIGWMSRPGIRQIVTFVLNIIEPFYFQTSSADPISIFWITVPLLLIVLIAFGLAVFNLRKLGETQPRYVFLLVVFVVLPVLITFVASWALPHSIWGTRHLIIVFAPFYICAAIILTSGNVRWLSSAMIGLVVVLAGFGSVDRAITAFPQNSWCAWEPLINEMALKPDFSSRPRRIYAFEQLIGYHIWFAGRRFPNLEVDVVRDFPGTREDAAYFIPRGFDQIKLLDRETAFAESEFWVAFREKAGASALADRPGILSEMHYLGFETVDTREMQVGDGTVFLVRMKSRAGQ